jgi:hypothetical protein
MKYVFFTLLLGVLLYFAIENSDLFTSGEDGEDDDNNEISGGNESSYRDSEPDPNNSGFSRRRTPRP